MAHIFACKDCSRQLTISDKLFDERIAGKRVSVRCKHCNSPLIAEDADQDGRPASVRAAPEAAPRATRPQLVRSTARSAKPTSDHAARAEQVTCGLGAAPLSLQRATLQRSAPRSAVSSVGTTKPFTAAVATRATAATGTSPVHAQAVRLEPSRSPVTARLRADHPRTPGALRSSAALPQQALQLETATSAEEVPSLARLKAKCGDRALLSRTVSQTILKPTEQPSNLIRASNPKRVATPPPLPTRNREPDGFQRVSDSTLVPPEAEPAETRLTPMPVLDVEPDAAADVSPLLENTSTSADAAEPPSQGRQLGEPELTPPPMTLAPDSGLRPLSQTFLRARASMLLAQLHGTRRVLTASGLTLFVSAAVAVAFGHGKAENERSIEPMIVAASTASNPAAMGQTVARLPETAVHAAALGASPTAPLPIPPTRSIATSIPSSSAEGDDGLPTYVSKPAVIHLSGIAMRRAQRCHPQGHAVGTARVIITFASNGTVSDARIDGEPLASAPVSRCILDHARSIRITKFEGAPFNYASTVTLR